MSDRESRFLIEPEEGVSAHSKPQFIIKVGESYFLTLAVWEYNEERAKTDDQREACRTVARVFDDHADRQVATVGSPLLLAAGTHINPPPKNPSRVAVYKAFGPEAYELRPED